MTAAVAAAAAAAATTFTNQSLSEATGGRYTPTGRITALFGTNVATTPTQPWRAQLPEEILEWKAAASVAFAKHQQRKIEQEQANANSSRSGTKQQLPSRKKIREWNDYMKLFLVKYQDGASDCNLISSCTIPLHPVVASDLTWFLVYAPSTTVANCTIPYEFALTDAYRGHTSFVEFTRSSSIKNIDRVFLEIEHPHVAALAGVELSTLGEKDLAKGKLPLVYPPLHRVDSYSFEQHKAYQEQFEQYWKTQSVLARYKCPTLLDLQRFDRHILAKPAYRVRLASLTRYAAEWNENIGGDVASLSTPDTGGAATSPPNPMAARRRLRPMRQYAGQLRSVDLFRMLWNRDTPEGRAKLAASAQGSLPWLVARLVSASASRVGKLVGFGHPGELKTADGQVYRLAPRPSGAGGGGGNPLSFRDQQTACRQAEMAVSEITDSMASLVQHRHRFQGNAMTRWGNKTEDKLRNVALFRLRTYEQHAHKFAGPIELENTGIETVPGHPFVGVSTDGNLLFGNRIPKSFEFKNPTYLSLSLKCEYAMQMLLVSAVRCLTNMIFCIGTPAFCMMMRYDFNPIQFEEVYYPRLWHNHLYFYLEAFLYTFNYRCMPPWLPHVVPDEARGDDPEKVYAAQLATLERLKDTYFVPEPEDVGMVLGAAADGSWNLPVPPDHPFANLTLDEVDETWRPDMIGSGYFSTMPFCRNVLAAWNASGKPTGEQKEGLQTLTFGATAAAAAAATTTTTTSSTAVPRKRAYSSLSQDDSDGDAAVMAVATQALP